MSSVEVLTPEALAEFSWQRQALDVLMDRIGALPDRRHAAPPPSPAGFTAGEDEVSYAARWSSALLEWCVNELPAAAGEVLPERPR